MSIAIVVAALVLLILQIGWLKLHPFIAFLVTALLAGWWLGIHLPELPGLVKKGVGSMLGDVVVVVVTGAMLGKLIAETGAAATIADTLTRWFGTGRVQWALMVTGFIAVDTKEINHRQECQGESVLMFFGKLQAYRLNSLPELLEFISAA